MEGKGTFGDENIVKPIADKKSYKLIRLPSGLKVLLVNTPSSKGSKDDIVESSGEDLKAAAALAVQVGSYADPPDLGTTATLYLPICHYYFIYALYINTIIQRDVHIFWR